MPFVSKAQWSFAHTKEGTKKLGGKKKVKEWVRATGDYESLPDRLTKKKKPEPKPAVRMRPGRG